MKKGKRGLCGRMLALTVVGIFAISLVCLPAYAENSWLMGFDANNQISFDFTNSETQQAFLSELNSTEENKLWTLIDGTDITANEGVCIEKTSGTLGFTFNAEKAGITGEDAIYIETDFVRNSGAGTWDWTYVNLSKNDIYLGLDQGTSIVMGKYGNANVAGKTFYEKETGKHKFKLQSYVNFKTGYVKSRMISLDVANDYFYRTFEGYPGATLANVSWKASSGMTVKNITIKKNPDLDSLFEVISTPLPSSLDKNNTLEIDFTDSAVAQKFFDASASLGNGYSNWQTEGSPVFTNDQTNSNTSRRGLQMKKGSGTSVLYLNIAPFADMGSTLYVEAEYYRMGYDWDWFGFVLNDSSSNLYLAKDTGRGGMSIGSTTHSIGYSKSDANYDFTVRALIDYAQNRAHVQIMKRNQNVASGVVDLGSTFNSRIGFLTNDATADSTGMVLHKLKIVKNPAEDADSFNDFRTYADKQAATADGWKLSEGSVISGAGLTLANGTASGDVAKKNMDYNLKSGDTLKVSYSVVPGTGNAWLQMLPINKETSDSNSAYIHLGNINENKFYWKATADAYNTWKISAVECDLIVNVTYEIKCDDVNGDTETLTLKNSKGVVLAKQTVALPNGWRMLRSIDINDWKSDGQSTHILTSLNVEKNPVPEDEIQVYIQAYDETEWVDAETLTAGMKIKAVANGYRATSKPYFFAIAVFEANGRMKNVYKAIDTGAAGEFSLETTEAELSAGDIVKVFAWNANDLAPKTEHIQKTVNAQTE